VSDESRLLITPETKIGKLLENYPFLEEILIEMAPPFEKLRNPVLRKTVARVTTLRHAAKVGGVNLSDLINNLRRNAGQTEAADSEVVQSETDGGKNSNTKPDWLEPGHIVKSYDARELIEGGEQPIGTVIELLKELSSKQILELITPFVPAPLIDKAKKLKYKSWSTEEESDLVKTYFYHE